VVIASAAALPSRTGVVTTAVTHDLTCHHLGFLRVSRLVPLRIHSGPTSLPVPARALCLLYEEVVELPDVFLEHFTHLSAFGLGVQNDFVDGSRLGRGRRWRVLRGGISNLNESQLGCPPGYNYRKHDVTVTIGENVKALFQKDRP
jgi:hypothetical protein